MTIRIGIDKRENPERVNDIITLFNTVKDIECVQDTYPIGDYVISKDNELLFLVEWKTYEDFVSSIQNGHLVSQLLDMGNCECPTYLIVTGNYKQWIPKAKKLHIHVTKEQINGFCTSLVRYKTKPIYYDSEKEGYLGLLKLVSMHKGDKTYEYKLPERKKHTGDINADMMLAIEGLGAKTVKELREHYTLTEFISACKDNTLCVKVKKPVLEYCKKL